MKSWIDFYDYYLSNLPGCTFFAAQNALRMAAQEFCDRSKVWRVTMDPVVTVANTSIYDFDITADQEIVKLLSAKLGGQNIAPLAPDQAEMAGTHGILVLNPREFMLLPDPPAGLSLVMKVAFKPSNKSSGVEDWIYTSFAEQIAAGAKARLMAEANKQYSDPKGSADNQMIFDAGIGSAVIKAAKAYSSAPLRTQASFM